MARFRRICGRQRPKPWLESRTVPPTILYALGRLDVGGAEMRSLQLLEALKRAHPELRILIYVFSGQKACLDPSFERAGMRIVPGRWGLAGVLHFWLTCLRERAGLVHTNCGMIGGYFVFAAFLAGVKIRICHFRVTSEHRFNALSRFRGRLGVFLMLLFGTAIVGVSAASRHYPRIPEHRWRTIYNGIAGEEPAAALANRPPFRGGGTRRLIVLGRIALQKNYVRAVSVFEALSRSSDGRDLRLDFVGTGSPEDLARLHARVASSPLAGAIGIHGTTDHPLDHLRGADLLLLTSVLEGLPGVVLEALSVGTPVVASDIPGTREIAAAVEGVTLVPLDAGDDKWSDAIRAALSEDRAESIIRSFRRGPFCFEAHAANMAALWGLTPAKTRGGPASEEGAPAQAGSLTFAA